MEGKGDKRFRAAALFFSFSILYLLMSDIASGEGLYTRMDELSWGNTVVQAYTTCTEDSHDDDTAVCTEQHFLFINKKTGTAVKVDASGKPVVERDLAGGKIKIKFDAFIPEASRVTLARSMSSSPSRSSKRTGPTNAFLCLTHRSLEAMPIKIRCMKR